MSKWKESPSCPRELQINHNFLDFLQHSGKTPQMYEHHWMFKFYTKWSHSQSIKALAMEPWMFLLFYISVYIIEVIDAKL